MHKRLYSFIELHDILFQMQFGFRNGHYTDHALISLSERIKSTVDSKRVGCGIFIDLQKAFDTVNHNTTKTESLWNQRHLIALV